MNDNSMQGRTIVVTGATNGIGEAIALELAARGAQTVIVGRDEARGAATTERIRNETGNSDVRYYNADLSVQAQVRSLAERLNSDLTRLDVLVNNAGAWFNMRRLSADGIEMTWALNHLAYFILTQGLTDLLKHTASEHGAARVINQASLAHSLEGNMHWDNLQFDGTWGTDGRGSIGAGWGVYSQSKLANVMHAFALSRRLAGTGVVANAVHPGVVVTGFTQNNGLIYRIATPFRRLMNRTSPADGAAPAVWLASAPQAATITGAYYGPPHQREETNPIAQDIDAQDRLWEMTEASVLQTAQGPMDVSTSR